ncbi:hypothetical protein BH10BDE1_BH10BDE1_34820 [soil metagenome]
MTAKSFIGTFFFAISITSPVALAGGSVVGNGAGLVENNFQYSYSMIPALISACFASTQCPLTESEKTLLSSIREIAVDNASNPDRLSFMTGGDQRGFFDTGISEKHRIAKTGLNRDEVIFVNSDLLYDEAGKPRLDYPSIISILVHEIGHQAGEPDHAALDILGAKIRTLAYDKTSPYSIQMDNGDEIDVTILNTDVPMRMAEFYFSWQGVGSTKATAKLTSGLACSKPDSNLAGIELTNGAFFLTRPLSNATISDVGFSVWVRLFCYDKTDAMLVIENYSVKAKIKKDLTLEILQTEKLH